MIHIVGGSYFEYCIAPHWSELYGSGGRAAAALSSLSDSVTLHSYIGENDHALLRALADTYGFAIKAETSSQTLSFHYFHGLSTPHITPPIGRIERALSLSIEADQVLCFGMLEADAIIQGQWVVYDPQDPLNAKPFQANGSKVGHLAIVANYGEAIALSGQRKLSDIGRVLLEDQKADVVVIKRGILGAVVITQASMVTVPAYCTNNVWPIGSGDVFGAVFAHFWAEQRLDAVEAAMHASLAAAYYCNTRTLPIPQMIYHTNSFLPITIQFDQDYEPSLRRQIYLAGPFFTMAQRWLIEEARAALQSAHLAVFSPLHDVGRGAADKVVQLDIAGIDQSDVVFAILDGRDTGTVFEVGYARAKGIPVIVFVQNETQEELKMLEGTNCTIVDDFVSAIYTTAWTALTS